MEEMILQLAQVGGVGVIAGLLFVQNRDHQKQMARRLETLEAVMLETLQNNTAAMQSIKNALDRRPCLAGDQAVKNGG